VSGPQNPPLAGFEPTNLAMQLNGVDQSLLTTLQPLNITTNMLTIIGWIYPTGAQTNYNGVVFSRGFTVTNTVGVNFGPASGKTNELGYTWGGHYITGTGLVVPMNQWSFFALVVTPTTATVYLGANGVLNSYIDTPFDGLPVQTVNAPLEIGRDGFNGRWFKGRIDEVAIYTRALALPQIQQLYSAGTGSGQMLSAFETWQYQYFGTTNGNAAATADPDGDGLNNMAEFLAGSNPTNSLSCLRIISTVKQGNNILVTWQTYGGRTNAVQAVTGRYATNFVNVSGSIIIAGSGQTVTNYSDLNGATNLPSRFYRIRLIP
jgi:hypothetical protein